MRKIVFIMLVVFLLTGVANLKHYPVVYTDNEPFYIEMKDEELKILQITDLHLMYGYDYRDQKTFELIKFLVHQDDFDLIVITGDLTMSPQAPSLFKRLIDLMESFETPWTFIFGNHERDFHDYGDFLNLIQHTKYLYFKVGPELIDGGLGNFKITFTKSSEPFYHTYFLDTKSTRKDYTESEGKYDYLSGAQVQWYEDFVSLDTVDSMVFMHIPLRQFIDPFFYSGNYFEDQVYAQGKDTGFFDTMVSYKKTKAVFVGHDHLNDFSFVKKDIQLIYGRATGYNGYGYLEKGGRYILVTENNILVSWVITQSEATS